MPPPTCALCLEMGHRIEACTNVISYGARLNALQTNGYTACCIKKNKQTSIHRCRTICENCLSAHNIALCPRLFLTVPEDHKWQVDLLALDNAVLKRFKQLLPPFQQILMKRSCRKLAVLFENTLPLTIGQNFTKGPTAVKQLTKQTDKVRMLNRLVHIKRLKEGEIMRLVRFGYIFCPIKVQVENCQLTLEEFYLLTPPGVNAVFTNIEIKPWPTFPEFLDRLAWSPNVSLGIWTNFVPDNWAEVLWLWERKVPLRSLHLTVKRGQQGNHPQFLHRFITKQRAPCEIKIEFRDSSMQPEILTKLLEYFDVVEEKLEDVFIEKRIEFIGYRYHKIFVPRRFIVASGDGVDAVVTID